MSTVPIKGVQVSRTLEKGDEPSEGSVVIECWTHTESAGINVGAGLNVTNGFNVLKADCDRQRVKNEAGFFTVSEYKELPKGETIEVPGVFGRYKVSHLSNGVVVKTRCRWAITRHFFGEATPEEVTLRAA